MPFTTGTATDAYDLLNDLNAYLTGLTSAWTVLGFTDGLDDETESILYLQGPGAGTGREVHIGIRTYFDAAIPVSGWEIRCMTDYDSGASFTTQPNVSPPVYLNLDNNSQDYWFFANDRRFIVVSLIGGLSYCSAYAGMFLPFALPDEYPQPLFVAAPYSIKATSAVSNSGNRFFADPGANAAYYLTRSTLLWGEVRNNAATAGQASALTVNEACHMWPHRVPQAASGVRDWTQEGLSMRPNAAGERPLFQCHIVDSNTNVRNVPGALDGVFSLPGFGLTATQAITVSSRNFRVFPNINRTGNRDFMAIEEVS